MDTGEWAIARRRRQLAADRRAGVFARSQARSLQYRFVRRNWRYLSLLIILTMGCGAVGLVAVPAGEVRAFFAGALVSAAIGLAAFAVVQGTSTAHTMMGDAAEQWTAQELRKWPKQWRLINHLLLRNWRDVDHVVLGPGGALAIETKWSAQAWKLPDDKRLAEHVARTRENAHDLNIWSPLRKVVQRDVTPLLVLWGPQGENAGLDEVFVGGVHVLRGSQLKAWWRTLPTDAMDSEQIERAWQALDQHIRAREALSDDLAAMPPSLYELSLRICAAVVVAIATFVLLADAIRVFDSYLWWAAVFAAFTTAALTFRRFARVRGYATTALATIAVTSTGLWRFVIYRTLH